jgi:hypothetical protein
VRDFKYWVGKVGNSWVHSFIVFIVSGGQVDTKVPSRSQVHANANASHADKGKGKIHNCIFSLSTALYSHFPSLMKIIEDDD